MCEVGSVAEPSPLTKANLVILVWVKKALYKPDGSPKLVLAFAPVLLAVADLKDDDPREPKPVYSVYSFSPAVLIIICHPVLPTEVSLWVAATMTLSVGMSRTLNTLRRGIVVIDLRFVRLT